jgi:eukaryotic-like serine/threonine-protein kinase
VTSACPSELDLLAFDRGTLPEARLDALEQHLEHCSACEATIRRLEGRADPLVDVMRKHIHASTTLRSRDWPLAHAVAARTETVEPDPTARENWPSVPGYEILSALGRGGMGVVYQARHLPLNRLVALKRLQTGTSSRTSRSHLEAEALAGLHHPNIVQIHEIIDDENSLFLSLELVDGGSLAAFLRGKPQPPLETARVLETLARAVHHAHTRGIIHRDLKPANILLCHEAEAASGAKPAAASSGSSSRRTSLSAFIPKIGDFGLAKRLAASQTLSRDGDVIGTPSYMAPEQASGKGAAIGPAADIYSLGVVLYEMVTGRVPLEGPSTLQTLVMVCEREPVPPRRIQPALPRDLETICLKCLQKDPARRYHSAALLAEDLRRFRATEPIVARPTPLWERGWKWARRRPALAGLLTLSLGVLLFGFPLVLFLWLRADRALVEVAESLDQLERVAYADNIALADHAVGANQIAAARSALTRCVPAAGRPDLRGWEWRYLRRLCNAELLPGIGHEDKRVFWAFALSFHPGNKYFVSAAGLPRGKIAGYPENAQEVTPGEAKVWDSATGRCLATLTGHQASIQSAAFSPDGRWLATGAADGTIIVRDGATFAVRSSFPPEKDHVHALVFSPASRLLAVGTTRSVIVWDVIDNRAKYKLFTNEPGGRLALAFSARGDRLAVGSLSGARGGELRIWDMATGQPLAHGVPPGPVTSLAFSSDSRYLAVSDGSDRIQVWDAPGSRLLRHLSTYADGLSSIIFSPDGRLVSAGEDRSVRIWNLESWTVEALYRGHALGILSVASSTDGLRLASSDKLGSVKLWDLKQNPAGVSFEPRPGNGEFLGHLAFSADGRHILDVVDLDGSPSGHYLEVRDPATGQLQSRFLLEPRTAHDRFHRILACSDDTRRLCGASWVDPELVQVYDTNDGSTIASCRVPGVEVSAVALTQSGDQFAQSGWKSFGSGAALDLHTDLSIFDTATCRRVRTLSLPPMHVATQLAFSPDGLRLATAIRATTWRDGQLAPLPSTAVHVWDLAGSKPPLVTGIRHDGPVTCLSFSPDGTRLASVGVDQTLQVVDSRSGHAVFPAGTESGDPTSVTFSADGRRLAAAGMDGVVRLWDATSGLALLSLRGFGPPGGGHYGFTARVTFSPDGTRLASNDWDGTVTIWDARQ